MTLTQESLLYRFAWQAISLLIGSLSLIWGISNLSRGVVSDQYLQLEGRVLRFETFTQATASKIIENSAVQNLSACDNHAQRALLLLEAPLATAALRSGAVGEFDRHIQSLDIRSRRLLACVPRDSLVWLVRFGLEVLHGHLDQHAFQLLSASYETSPNEAWVAMRRMIIAIPVVLAAPQPIKERILTEFEGLIVGGYPEIPARSYLAASAPIRALLQSRVEQLDQPNQKAFSEALQKFGT